METKNKLITAENLKYVVDNIKSNYLTSQQVEDKIKTYTAGNGIVIDENNVISCVFSDGTEVKY